MADYVWNDPPRPDDPAKPNISLGEAMKLVQASPIYVNGCAAAARKYLSGGSAQFQSYMGACMGAWIEARAVVWSAFDVAGSYTPNAGG